MKKTILILQMMLLACTTASAQVKSVSILGDSYSTFGDFITPKTNHTWYSEWRNSGKNDVNNVRQTWWHQVISQKGWKLCVNNSFSGSTISYLGYAGEDYYERSFLSRMDNLGCPDVILIFGATNDSWAKVPMGNFQYGRIDPALCYTFRPAMARLLQHVLDRYPSTEIYFLLNNGLTEEINTSVKTICEHYGVKCIELQDIDKQSGHPSVKGMQQIAEQVLKQL